MPQEEVTIALGENQRRSFLQGRGFHDMFILFVLFGWNSMSPFLCPGCWRSHYKINSTVTNAAVSVLCACAHRGCRPWGNRWYNIVVTRLISFVIVWIFLQTAKVLLPEQKEGSEGGMTPWWLRKRGWERNAEDGREGAKGTKGIKERRKGWRYAIHFYLETKFTRALKPTRWLSVFRCIQESAEIVPRNVIAFLFSAPPSVP